METTRNITVTLEKARKWYCSKDAILNELALQAFTEQELCAYDFTQIKDFEDALTFLLYSEGTKAYIRNTINDISMYSKASAAMAKLNIIKKALNLGQDLHLTEDPKNSYIYYPLNRLVTEESVHYHNALISNTVDVIGKVKYEEKEYYILGGSVFFGNHGLGNFFSPGKVGAAYADIAFLGCGNKEIAQHFGKYFGVLITEAKFGDLPGFEII